MQQCSSKENEIIEPRKLFCSVGSVLSAKETDYRADITLLTTQLVRKEKLFLIIPQSLITSYSFAKGKQTLMGFFHLSKTFITNLK